MNIIVCIKQTADLQQVRIRRETREPILESVPLTIGDIDKNAIEEAVRMKERLNAKVTLISAGSAELEETIKEGLAIGADAAQLIVDEKLDGAESYVAATALAKTISKIGEYDLILLGEGSADNYSGQVGPFLAEMLDLPFVAFVREIEIHEGKLKAVRNMDDCLEVVETNLPAVVTVLSEINEPRIPSVTQILKAGRKPIEVLAPGELGMDIAALEQKVRVLSNIAPIQDRKHMIYKEEAEAAVSKLYSALKADGAIGRY